MNLYDHYEKLIILSSQQQKDYIEKLSDQNQKESLWALLSSTSSDVTHFFEKSLATAANDLEPGELIGQSIGKYSVESMIASGGMGTVYKANRADGEYEQTVAIKVFPVNVLEGATDQEINNEAQSLANLNHPNVVHIVDAGKTQDGLVYIAMQYVEGQTVSQFIEKNQPTEKERLTLFISILEAIIHAHNNQVLHKDIKPQNILVDQSGSIKVVDFGVSKLIIDEKAKLAKWYFRALSIDYAAPEQINGEPVSSSADVFSLGRLLFNLLTEQKPEISNFSEQITSAQIPKPLVAIIDTATQSIQNKRYQSVLELKQDIEAYLSNNPISAYPHQLFNIKKWCIRHASKIAASVAIITTAVVGGISVHYQSLDTQKQQLVAETNLRLAENMLKQVDITLSSEFERQLSIIESAKEIGIEALPNQQKVRLLTSMAEAYKAVGDYEQFDTYSKFLLEEVSDKNSIDALIAMKMRAESDVLFQRFESAVTITRALNTKLGNIDANEPKLLKLLDWEFKTLDRFLVPEVLEITKKVNEITTSVPRNEIAEINALYMDILVAAREKNDFPLAIERSLKALEFAESNIDTIPIRYWIRHLMTWSELAHNRGAPPEPEVFKNKVVNALGRLEVLINKNHPMVTALALHVGRVLSGIEDPDYTAFINKYKTIELNQLVPAYQVDKARMVILNKLDTGRYPEAYEDIINIVEVIPLESADSMALYQVIAYLFDDFSQEEIEYEIYKRIVALAEKYNDQPKVSYFAAQTCARVATRDYEGIDDYCLKAVELAKAQYGDEGYWTLQRKREQFARWIRKDIEKAKPAYKFLQPYKDKLTGTWKVTLLRAFIYYHLKLNDVESARKYFDEYSALVKKFTNNNFYNLGNMITEVRVLVAEGKKDQARALVLSQKRNFCAQWPYEKSLMKQQRELHKDLNIEPEDPCPNAITWQQLVGDDQRLISKFNTNLAKL